MKPFILAALLVSLVSAGALAQVPADLAAANRAIGKVNDLPASVRAYAPLAEKAPYSGAKVTRDLSYGPDPKNLLDVFQPTTGPGAKPVLIYISGGDGLRTLDPSGSGPFFDNVPLWASKHGMVGVNLGRSTARELAWDAGVRDVAAALRWVRANIGRYGGDPQRIFFLGHGVGATPVSVYLATPEYWGGSQPGIKGAVFLSAPLNVAPLVISERPNEIFAPAHSVLQGMLASKVPLYIGLPEYANDGTRAASEALRQELCKTACPGFAEFKDHQHFSLVLSLNTPDESVAKPMLDWIRGHE